MRRILVAAVAAFFMLAGPVAAQNYPFAFGGVTKHLQYLVEQQTPGGAAQTDPSLWVVNNTGCGWDPDDQMDVYGFGYLDPAGSASASICVIGDWAHRQLVGIDIKARSPDLSVAVLYDPGRTFVFSRPVFEGANQWHYRGCLIGPRYGSDYAGLEPILDSNGGLGVPVAVTLALSNETGRRIREISAHLELDLDYAPNRALYCAGSVVRIGLLPGPIWDIGL